MPEAQALPVRPDLNWYKKAAKKRLNQLRAHHPDTRLADAQLSIAREHGFSSWRKLKDRIDQLIDLPKLFDAIRNDDRPAIRELIRLTVEYSGSRAPKARLRFTWPQNAITPT